MVDQEIRRRQRKTKNIRRRTKQTKKRARDKESQDGCIEKKEYVLLKRILNISSYAKDFDTQRAIKCLNDNLKNAQILDEEDVPTHPLLLCTQP